MNHIMVTILPGDVVENSGTFTDDEGKEREYTTRKQKAKLEVCGFAYPFEVRIERTQKPYAPGVYYMDAGAMVSVNKGAINWSKYPVLVAAETVAKARQ